MNDRLKKYKILVLIIGAASFVFCHVSFAKTGNTLIDIRMGSYSEYSRIVLDFEKKPAFFVSILKKNARVKVGLSQISAINKKVFEKSLHDKRIKSVILKKGTDESSLIINYRDINDSIYYFVLNNPYRLIFDVRKGKQGGIKKAKAAIKKGVKNSTDKQKNTDSSSFSQIGNSDDKENHFIMVYSSDKKIKVTNNKTQQKKNEPVDTDKKKEVIKEEKENLPKEKLISDQIDAPEVSVDSTDKGSDEVTAKKEDTQILLIDNISLPNQEEKKIFKDSLFLYQEKNFPEAIEGFENFIEQFPESKYAEDAKFLIADGYFNIAQLNGGEKDYHKAIAKYKDAMNLYPNSKKVASAQYKIGKTYSDIKFFVEAKIAYDDVITNYKGSIYEQPARFGIARVLLQDKKFTQAYNEFVRGTAIDAKSIATRNITFFLANKLFEHKDYIIAERLYEDAMKKWPGYAHKNPDVLFGIGTTYLKNDKLIKAKDILFDLVNLYPEAEIIGKALLIIGDYYHAIGDDKDSLKLYVEAISRLPDGNQGVLGKLKMANLGATKKNIDLNSLIFNTAPYKEPLKTYDSIENKFSGTLIASEAMFRKGEIYYKENNYLKAVLTLKDMIEEYPESPFIKKGIRYLREIMYKLIDSYHKQGGYLPVLNLYHSNSDPFLADITRSSIVYKIGESYQKSGIYDFAEKNYKKLEKMDNTGFYDNKLELNRARMFFYEDKYSKAEKMFNHYIKTYPLSKDIPEATYLHVLSLFEQGKYKKAISKFHTIIKTVTDKIKKQNIYYYLGMSYFELKDFKNASFNFSQAIRMKKFGKDKKELSWQIKESFYYNAISLYNGADYKNAVTALQIALKKFSDNEWLIYLLAKSYEKLKKGSYAKKMYEKLDKNKGTIYATAAGVEVKNNDWIEENRKYFKKR